MELQSALVASAVQLGDVELAELVLSYVESCETSQLDGLVEALKHIIATKKEKTSESRERRGTKWDESNLGYDIVALQSSRAADVRNYPNHTAYIWGKTIGIDKANFTLGAGLFIGHHPTCPNLKVFGKAIAQANILWWSWKILNAEVLLEKTNSQLRTKVYFKLLNNVLTDWSSTSNCATLPITLYSSPRYSLPRVSYPVIVYVGTLTFYLQPRAQVHIDFQAELCVDTGRVHTAVGLGPRFTFTVEGGITGNLLVRLYVMCRCGD